MTSRRYPNYTESGESWLGLVPAHWQLRRLGYFFSERREKVSDADYPPLSVTKNGVVPQLETAAKTDDGDNRKRVAAGDFVINSRSDRKGSSGLSELDGSVSLINTVLEPHVGVHPRFVHHLLRSTAFQEEFYRYGKGIVADLWSTNYSEMRGISLAMPPAHEQSAIADFLDREMAKIDALVEEQRRLIHLLKEKRQAVISRAVTKGLGTNAKMKPSGVEWLGDMPAHWTLVPLRRLTEAGRPITYGIVQPGDPDLDGRYMVRGQDYSKGWVPLETVFRVSAEVEEPYRRARLACGDLVMTIVGAGLGNTAVVPQELEGANITQTTARIAPDRDIVRSDYLALALSSWVSQTQVQLYQKGAAQPGLNLEHLKAFQVPLPPTTEQEEIASWLGSITPELDELVSAANSAVELLTERRSALISAAVTGKIEVREYVDHEGVAA